jgi:predicted MPP superfamily phosphohydrolase
MISAAGFLCQLYVARRAIGAVASVSKWPRRYVRLGVGGFFFLPAVYPLLLLANVLIGRTSTVLSSSFFVDSLLTYPFWIGLVIVVQLAVVFALLDLVRIIVRVAGRNHVALSIRAAWLVIALSAAMPAYVTGKVLNDTLGLRTTSTEFRVEGLPPELEGFRIVQIGDIQVDARTNDGKLDRYINTVNRLQPDLILFCGDLVTSGTAYITQGAEAVGRMESRLGVYGALGDHDFFSDRDQVVAALTGNGVTILDDESVTIPIGASRVALTGVTNVYRRRAAGPAVEALERQRPHGSLNILVTHQPSEWLVSLASDRGYSLFVAGHTHGGQIVFPLPGFPLSGSRLETRYVTGFYHAGPMLVSTTNGLGLTLAPIRYHAPAEVTLIIVKR